MAAGVGAAGRSAANIGAGRPDFCPDCGAQTGGGREGCQRLFEEVVGREFSQPELFQVHHLTVDAYSLQHPERYMKSAKSGAAHLTGMCWSLEHGGGPEVSRFLSRWLDGAPELPRLVPPSPGERGKLTILEVHAAGGLPDHIQAVKEWARSAWEAWKKHHGQGRAWVAGAMGRRGP